MKRTDNFLLSRYICIREKNNYLAVFHHLHANPVFVRKNRWQTFINDINKFRKTKLFQDLLSRKLIVNSVFDDNEEYNLISQNLISKLNQPTILYLMLSQGCNFSCQYCPIPKQSEKYGNIKLKLTNALAGIDLWSRHIKDVYDLKSEYYLILYGGEPLLNQEIIKPILKYLRKKQSAGDLPKKNLNLMLCTNGSRINEDVIELCKKYKIIVAIGLDGPTKFHNRYRVDNKGKETFNATLKAIKLLISHNIKTVVSTTLIPNTVNNLSSFSKFYKEIGIDKFGFNFLKGKALSQMITLDKIVDYHTKASKAIIKNSKSVKNINYEYQMDKKIIAFKENDFFPVDCTCYGNQIVVQADGQISNCPFYKPNLGQVSKISNKFRIWNTDVVKKWRRRLPLYHPEFQSLDYLSLCGGGCAWSNLDESKDILSVDQASKIFTKEVFDELIWKNLKK